MWIRQSKTHVGVRYKHAKLRNINCCTNIYCTADPTYHKHAQLGYDLNSNWINVHFTHFWQCSPQTCNHDATAFYKIVTQIPSDKYLY